MKNKRSFRAPVVMTLAAGAMAAAVSGCGGDVVTGLSPGCPTEVATVGTACDPTVSTEVCNYGTALPGCPGAYPNARVCNPTTRQWMSVTATCNPPPPMCPTTPPAEGAGCVGALSCDYDSCEHQGVAGARCVGGQWQLARASCNPPPPPMCPATPPMQGGLCVGDLACEYDGCTHNGVWSARCSGGRWDLQRGSCNPPPPACPPTAPSDGQPCQPGFGIAVCPYGPPGCGMGSAVFTCGGESGSQWRRRPVLCDTSPGCPAYAPDANTFCTPAPTTQYCVYASTNPCDPSHRAFRCDDTGRWTPAISSCNPPPPDGGTEPDDGGTEPDDGGTDPGDGGTEPGDAG